MRPEKLLIVGEVNPYGSNPKMALYALPRHASGNRLRKVMGVNDRDYEDLRKVNLCYGKWTMTEAKQRARGILSSELTTDVVLMLGRKVTEAFCPGQRVKPFTSLVQDGKVLISFPHPSGLCRAWNELGAIHRARLLLIGAVPRLPWGSCEE